MSDDRWTMEKELKLYKNQDQEKVLNYLKQSQIAQNNVMRQLRQDVNMLQSHRESFFDEMKKLVGFLVDEKLKLVKKKKTKKKVRK